MTVYIVEYFNPERPEDGADIVAIYDNLIAAKADAAQDPKHLQVSAYKVKSKVKVRTKRKSYPS